MRSLNKSGFRVWSRSDVEGLLEALEQSTAEAGVIQDDSYEMKLYYQGYAAALRSVARMFGLDGPSPRSSAQFAVFHTIDSQARIIS
jgi:hypothetical protein